MSEHDLMPLAGELRDLIDADHQTGVASDPERAAIRKRVLLTIGIGVAGAGGIGGVGGASAAGSGGAGVAGAGAGGVSAATIATSASAGKIIAVTIAATVATGGVTLGVRELRDRPAHTAKAERPIAAPATPDPRPPTPITPATEQPAAIEVANTPPVTPPESAVPRARVAKTAAPSPASVPDVVERPRLEATMIGEMSQALRTGEAARALTLVAEHEHAYRDGALAEERDALRIDALILLGRTRDAHERASRFRARYPGSLHTARIDRALASHEDTP